MKTKQSRVSVVKIENPILRNVAKTIFFIPVLAVFNLTACIGSGSNSATNLSMNYSSNSVVQAKQAFTSVYSFGISTTNDGSKPKSNLIQASDGNLYGTTQFGGTNGNGTVFKITPSGVETPIYSFGTNSNDGTSPVAALIQARDGNFYGTTAEGGANGTGTVFKITLRGNETVLYSFGTNANDGANPIAPLIQGYDGNFYGTTHQGGTNSYGTVFKITPDGHESLIYSFDSIVNDGMYPNAALFQGRDGSFYGTTSTGGVNNNGTVYQISPMGIESVIYSFGTNNDDGVNPNAALIMGNAGNLYGTTTYGGSGSTCGISGCGTVYSLSIATGLEQVIYSFGTNSNDGTNPNASLIQDSAGNLYGTTTHGGGVNNYGTVFKLTPQGSETILHSFQATDGAYPTTSLIQAFNGNIYGTASQGGTYRFGTIFSLGL